MNSSPFSEVRPGPVDDAFHRDFALSARTGDHAGRARGDQRRHAVGRRRRIAEVAGQRRAALDLGRADQVGALDHAGPGLPQTLVLADHGAGGRGADDEGAVLLANAENARDLLGVDDMRRLHAAGTQLDQQIGPAGQDLRAAGGAGEDANRVLDGRGG